MEKRIINWQMVIEWALKLKYNDVASGLSGLPTFQTSHRIFLSVCSVFFLTFSLCLPLSSSSVSISFSLQEFVLQQFNSSGWRESGSARGSPHPPAGPQLYQPHQRGSLQRPQGFTHPVSTPAHPQPPLPSPKQTPNSLIMPLLTIRLRRATWEQWKLRCLILFFAWVTFDS